MATQENSPTYKNIRAISQIERDALAKRSSSAILGDVIALRAGQMWFIILHLIWFAVWIWINSPFSPWKPFDAFPYPLLTMVVSLESIFLALFILMSQNRTSAQADHRNHLDLQINLLSEDENTKIIQMLAALCKHHGLAIATDPEIERMAERTNPGEVLKDIEESLPPQEV